MDKPAQGMQRAVTEQLEELAQAQPAVDLQKREDAAFKNLEAERARLQGVQVNLERNAVQAIHDAVRKQSGGLERQTVQAFAAPLQDIKQRHPPRWS